MNGLFNVLTIANMVGGILSFFIGLSQLKKHHRSIALFFFFGCSVAVLSLMYNSIMPPRQSLTNSSAQPGAVPREAPPVEKEINDSVHVKDTLVRRDAQSQLKMVP